MRKIGIQEIEDIARGAALLGAGGGGDPYIGKLVAIGAVKEFGPVTLLDPDEVPDDALLVPFAMMGAPTVFCEKMVSGNEYKALFDIVGSHEGKKVFATMPMEAGGLNSLFPVAAAAKLGLPLVDCDGIGECKEHQAYVTFQNENLAAAVDGEIVATTPDLITLVDTETFNPVPTDALKYGKRVIIVGLKCFEMWRSEAGIELVGPRYFGIDTDYVPIEIRSKGGWKNV